MILTTLSETDLTAPVTGGQDSVGPSSGLGGDAGGTSFDVVVQFDRSPPRTARVQVAGRPSPALPPAMQSLDGENA